MPGSSNANNSSFIPKRGPARRRKPKTKNQIFIFTIITYSLLFASLLAAGGTFLYKNYLTSQLESEVEALNTQMATFSNEDLSRVREFDVTLKRATDRVDNAASVVAVLDGIDGATVAPVQIKELSVSREADTGFTLTGSVMTTSFDAAMFQRKIYNLNRRLLSVATVEDVAVAQVVESLELNTDPDRTAEQEVTFAIALAMPLEEVLYDPETALLRDDVDATTDLESASETASSTESTESTDSIDSSEVFEVADVSDENTI